MVHNKKSSAETKTHRKGLKKLSKDKKEITSSLTHLAGAILALAGTVVLLIHSLPKGEGARNASVLTFGISMVLLYTASATYHWVDEAKEKLKLFMRKIDHMAIFVLIAGTYTPLCVMALDKPSGWILLVSAWGVAFAGFLMKIFWMNAPQWISSGLYVAMGWMSVFEIKPLAKALSSGGTFWLAAGGIIYTIGAFIYGLERPRINISWFGSHELFHLFVIAGTACHYVMVYSYVA